MKRRLLVTQKRMVRAAMLTAYFSASLYPFPGNGRGTVEEPYQITTATELDSIRHQLNAYFVLMNDLNFKGTQYDGTDHKHPGGWPGIGDFTNSFSGSFDGNGHVIRNLHADSTGGGLFSYCGKGTIRNVGIVDCFISGDDRVGALVGENEYGTIDSCYSAGVVTGSKFGVGGLVGVNYHGTMSNCHSSCTVTGTSDRVGGLVGENVGGTLWTCYAVGNVYDPDTAWSSSSVGGLVGMNSEGSISECFAACSVIAAGGDAGGLVGFNTGTIAASYFLGSVVGNKHVGGIAGSCGLDNYTIGTITDCYAIGAVQGYSCVGGLAGRAIYSGISRCYAAVTETSELSSPQGIVGCSREKVVSGSYWNIETSSIDSGVFGTGKTTAEMRLKTTFYGWDFINTWMFDPAVNNGCPTLRWQQYGHVNAVVKPLRNSGKEGMAFVRQNAISSHIKFVVRIPKRQQVRVVVLNLDGRVIGRLVDRELPAGEYTYLFAPSVHAAAICAYEAVFGTYQFSGLLRVAR